MLCTNQLNNQSRLKKKVKSIIGSFIISEIVFKMSKYILQNIEKKLWPHDSLLIMSIQKMCGVTHSTIL